MSQERVQSTIQPNPAPLADAPARQMELFRAISDLIVADASPETITRVAADKMVQNLGYQAVQVYRLSPFGNDIWLYIEAGRGLKPVTQNVDIFSIDEDNIISQAVKTKQLQVVPDIQHSPYSYFDQDTTAGGITSEIAVPLLCAQTGYGVLRVQSAVAHAFNRHTQSFLTSVAGLLAGVIKNAQTLRQLQDNLQEINILYNLQRNEELTYQSHSRRGEPTGFRCDLPQAALSPLTEPPAAARFALASDHGSLSAGPNVPSGQIMAPIKLHGETIGILGVEDEDNGRGWNPDDLALLEEISDQVGLAIENSRLLHQTQARTRDLSILFEFSRRLSETTNLHRIYELLAAQLISFLQADCSRVLIINKTRTHFEEVVSKCWERGKSSHVIDTHVMGTGQETIEQTPVLQQIVKQPQLIIEHLPTGEVAAQTPPYTITHFPLVVRNSVVGVLRVRHLDSHRDFSQNELQLTQAIIAQAAVAIENALSLEKTTQGLAETQKLYEISRMLVESGSLEETYEIILGSARAFNVDRVSISLLKKDTAGQTVGVAIVASWDRDSADILPVGSPVFSEVFPLVEAFARPPYTPLISENLTRPDHQDERMDEGFRQLMVNQLKAITLFSAPMYLGSEYKGVLSISTRGPHVYTDQEQRIYQTLADQAIIAIERHRLFEETQQNLFNSEILSRLSQQLLVADTTDAIYQLIINAIAATNPGRGAGIFVYDHQETDVEMELRAIWNTPGKKWPQIAVGARYSTQTLGINSLLTAGQTVAYPNVPDDEKLSPTFKQLLSNLEIQSYVSVPLWIAKAVGGFIMISNHTPTLFNPETIRLYENISRLASGALDNRRLFAEAQYRAAQLQTAAEVSQAATGYLDLDTLLTQTVNLVRDRFNFYHASIFLVDDYQKYAVIKASTGEVGQKMLAVQHKLTVGGKSIVGAATGSSQPRIALDVGQDAVHFNNPLLPDTRSEMALPLIARGRVIGALDVQSTQCNAFTENDVTILQSMANQLANAIEAARSYQEARTALDEVGRIQQRYARSEWSRFVKEQQAAIGYRLTENGFTAVESPAHIPNKSRQLIRQALSQKETVQQAAPANGKEKLPTPAGQNLTGAAQATVAAPLTLHGQVTLGALDFDAFLDDLQNQDTLHIIEAVAAQAAQAIQAARLFEQTQVAHEEAEALYRVGHALVMAESEQEMHQVVLREMLGMMGLKQGGVLFIEPDRKFGQLRALFVNGRPVEPDLRIPITGNPSYEKLIATRQPVAVDDFENDPLVAPVREIILDYRPASLLLVPIIINGEVVGALGADAVEKMHHFTEREINLVTAMAGQLSISLQNRQLLEETRNRALELQRTAERLQELDKLKTQFLANMSHELRTPLNSIIGFSRVILKGIDGPLTELQKTDLTSIYNSGQHLLGLINNILDLSKIEAGKMELNFEEMEIEPVIKGVMSTAIALVKDKSVSLVQEVPENLPHIWADPTRIRQIILNLVSNACKFTDSGSVTLRAFVQNDHLLVSVADTGIGIAPDKLDHVFEEFTQVDASTTRKAGGTGLGLPISRFFVEMHRGRIWVESSMGRGSTFNFIIPIKAHPQNQAEAETTPAGIGVPNIKTVIAIDPDAGVINLYRRFLEKHAYKIAHLPHDPNLVSRVKELLPAAILLETLVPNQDGWQILKDLKQDSLTRDIPVIICSINADKNKAVSQGAADHLTKPIVESDLIATLNHVLTVQNEHTRVLVIDDHADDILLIRRILEAHNYLVSEASSGRAGVELARSRPPNLILLDLTMPGMDGFAVVQALKSHAATQHIPIIVVSAKELSPHESSRLEGHVAVLLHKGAFTETKLLEVVRKSLHQGEE